MIQHTTNLQVAPLPNELTFPTVQVCCPAPQPEFYSANGKQCYLWSPPQNTRVNYKRGQQYQYAAGEISNSPWSAEEDETLLRLYENIGPQWSKMTDMLPGRTIPQIRSRRNAIESRKRQRLKSAMKHLQLTQEKKMEQETVSKSNSSPAFDFSIQSLLNRI